MHRLGPRRDYAAPPGQSPKTDARGTALRDILGDEAIVPLGRLAAWPLKRPSDVLG
jgi:hypothetical protein